MKFRWMIGPLLVLALAVAGGLIWTGSRAGAYSVAEYSVRNLSCGSCVRNIRNALHEVDGIGEVEVSVTAGRAKVEYDPSAVNPESIAGRMGKAGYPSTLIRKLSASDSRLLREDANRLANRFVGRIGERLVGRPEFKEVLSRYEEQGAVPKGKLLRTVWEEIMQREILLNAAERNGVVVQDGEVDREWQKMQEDNGPGFEARLARFGGEEGYRRRLKEDLTIQRTIEEFVLKGVSGPERRLRLDRWYRDFAAAVPVDVFDPALKAAMSAGGAGCGGSCCG